MTTGMGRCTVLVLSPLATADAAPSPCMRLVADHGPAFDRCMCGDRRLGHADGGRCMACYPRCASFALDPQGLDHEPSDAPLPRARRGAREEQA